MELPPTIHVHIDGTRLIVENFPEHIFLHDVVLRMVDEGSIANIRRDGDRVYFTFANGEATYVLGGYDLDYQWVEAHRLYAKMES